MAIYCFTLCSITKFSDYGAYTVGSLIGKHKRIPRISPGKNWEGFAGAIVFPTLASSCSPTFPRYKMHRHDLEDAIILA